MASKSKLKRLREQAGVDQRTLADLSGIRNYWRLESGAEWNPRIRHLVQLALLFDVPLLAVCERDWYRGDPTLFAPSKRPRLDRQPGATRIARLRALRGLTVREVSARSRLPLASYVRIEQGVGRTREPAEEGAPWHWGSEPNPRIRDLVALARVFRVPLVDVCEPDWLEWDRPLAQSPSDRELFISMKTRVDAQLRDVPPPLVPHRQRVRLR